MRTHRAHFLQTTAILAPLFLAAWLPRVLSIEAFVTPDERRWLSRSANFYQAVSGGNLGDTFQMGHPGVTVMWAGTLGFMQRMSDYPQRASAQVDWLVDELEAWLEANSSVTPLELLVAGRWWIVLAVSLAIATSFLPLRVLFGQVPVLLGVLFVAWDPFFIALSRQLHPDGLLAALAFLAFLIFLAWLCGPRRWTNLVAAGVVLGLTGLTKTPAAFVALAGGRLILLQYLQSRDADSWRLSRLLLAHGVWGSAALVTLVGLWPALWVGAWDVFQQMAGEMGTYLEGHSRPNFFMGQPTGDPGPLFYPLAFLFRFTPAVSFGLLAAAVLAWRRRWPLDGSIRRHSVLALVGFALLFAAGMTLGAKKFDRYILPVFPVLSITASLGWLGMAKWLWQRWRLRRADLDMEGGHRGGSSLPRGPVLLACAGLLLFHAWPSFAHHPYYLTYYNPLAGGSRMASRALFIGWGEGLNDAADWINQQPGASRARVISWYSIGPLSYYLRGATAIWPYGTTDLWFSADYAVLYTNQWQRELPAQEITQYFDGQEPAYEVRLHGLEMARIYDLRRAQPPAFLDYSPETAASFDYRILFKGYELKERILFPGDRQHLALRLEAMGPILADYDITLTLMGPDGREWWRSQRQPGGGPTSQWPIGVAQPEQVEFLMGDNAPPGRYTLMLRFDDPAIGQSVPLARGHDRTGGEGATHPVTGFYVQNPVSQAVDAQFEPAALVDLRHQPYVVAGETLLVEMGMAGQVEGSVKVSARLLDPAGSLIAQHDHPVLSQMRFQLPLPSTAASGT